MAKKQCRHARGPRSAPATWRRLPFGDTRRTGLLPPFRRHLWRRSDDHEQSEALAGFRSRGSLAAGCARDLVCPDATVAPRIVESHAQPPGSRTCKILGLSLEVEQGFVAQDVTR